MISVLFMPLIYFRIKKADKSIKGSGKAKLNFYKCRLNDAEVSIVSIFIDNLFCDNLDLFIGTSFGLKTCYSSNRFERE